MNKLSSYVAYDIEVFLSYRNYAYNDKLSKVCD